MVLEERGGCWGVRENRICAGRPAWVKRVGGRCEEGCGGRGGVGVEGSEWDSSSVPESFLWRMRARMAGRREKMRMGAV